MKWRSLLFVLIVLPAVLYGGLRGYLWYSIKETVNDIQRRVTGVGFITYEEIRTPVLGPIGVRGITYTPQGLNEVVEIGSVLVHWNEPLDLVDLIQAFYRKQLPKRLMLSINQIKIPLGVDTAAWWDKQKRWSSIIPVKIPDAVLGCGSGRFYSADFRNMGYESLISNVRFEYKLPPRSNKLSFYTAVRNSDMASISVEGSIRLPTPSLSVDQLLTSAPMLTNASITLDDGAYSRRKITYCSKNSSMSADQYVDRYLQQVASELGAHNLPPSPELTEAVRDHLIKGTNLTVNINPYEPLGPATPTQLDRENFVEWLDLEVISGDRLITEITAPVQPDPIEEEQAPEQREEAFNPTPVEQLAEHVGQLAKIQTKDGVLSGYVQQVEGDAVTLTQSMVGGSVTFVVKLIDIREASIFY